MLERTPDGIVLEVSWSSSDDGPLPRWFRAELDVADPVASAAPPRRLLFRDRQGYVVLLGCRSGGYTTLSGGPGTGRVLVRHVVFDSPHDHDFEHVLGLRTTISHLRGWVGAHAWSHVENSDGAYELHKDLSDDIDLGMWAGARITLCPVGYVRERDETDRIELESALLVETQTDASSTWDRHLRAHRALRDLLVVSGWHDEVARVDTVQHADDLFRYREDATRLFWRRVMAEREKPATRPKHRYHLIEYNDLGVDGLRRWFSIRDRFARAIDPIVSSIGIRNVTPVALLAQVGPGLEALGYELARRDGLSKKRAGDVNLADRLARILQDVADVLPFDGAQWVTRTVRTYNGVKHANRTIPDDLDVLNVERECVLVVRAWCAVELGVDRAALRERIRRDPLSRPWIQS